MVAHLSSVKWWVCEADLEYIFYGNNEAAFLDISELYIGYKLDLENRVELVDVHTSLVRLTCCWLGFGLLRRLKVKVVAQFVGITHYGDDSFVLINL